jgi:putative membrane protein
MLAPALIAFGHFVAFFALAAALVLELALLGESMSVETAKRIQRADRVVGITAILVLVFGFLRVIYFENVAALISLIPTMQFVRWNHELKQGIAPDLTSASVKRLKSIIHWQLVLIGGIMLCASLMAKGFGV